ncbi:MAG: tRNA lysidine(34) synthetase TilS [Bacteroidales bacterium]|nr:tRNA lysidine(34) synthetase TilS [Bacteroidales bacterium]
MRQISQPDNNMQERFTSFVRDQNLFSRDNKILLAVSGGIDSVVMLYLFRQSGFQFGMAHCNFHLRGIESDGDEQFIQQLARQYNITHYTAHFNTEEYARENKLSIQMAARELRYNWFEEICDQHGYTNIATAHNQDDVIETFMINLGRGTGIRGLTGIKPKTGRIIRPLLFASRSEIEKFANECAVEYREDSSNISVYYTRNKIRHEIIPLFEEINPSFRSSLIETIRKLNDTENIYLNTIENIKNELVEHNGESAIIDLEKLEPLPNKLTVLFEILSGYQFLSSQIASIIDSSKAHSGKQFYSGTHRLIKDRNTFIVTPLKETESKRYYIDEGMEQVREPISMDLLIVDNNHSFTIPRQRNVACLDYGKLNFPLIFRKWHDGDYFQPLGMVHKKKLSDFLIDEKLSIADKEDQWLLISGDDIVWVVNQRIDERYKVTDKTRQILMVETH